MDYIAVIDYEHMDNGVFLTAFARALANQKESRGLFIHGESKYTERLIQTGMMREDAVIRSIKDLNHRMIALLADYGVATIGLNGYQRSLIRQTQNAIEIDKNQFERLPQKPHILLSNLVDHYKQSQPVPLALNRYAPALSIALEIENIFVFQLDDSVEIINKKHPDKVYKNQLDESLLKEQIPVEFREATFRVRLTSARAFADYPSLKGSTLIVSES